MSEVRGECAPRFAKVREAFEANFAAGREVGASFAVTLHGEPVVDLWGGFADAARTRPWQRDTIVNVFSTTKAMTALCAHLLVDRGRLDLDAPVARLWPEFAGRASRRCRCAGCSRTRPGSPRCARRSRSEALFDWERMTGALAAEAPWWEPGTRERLSRDDLRLPGGRGGAPRRRPDPRRAVPRGAGRPARRRLPHRAAGERGRPRRRAGARRAAEEVAAAGQAAVVDPESLLGKVMGNPPLAAGPGQHPAVAARRDPRRERPRQRALRGARDGGPRGRRAARRRAPAPRGDPRARDLGAVLRAGPRAADPDALGPRLHAHPAAASRSARTPAPSVTGAGAAPSASPIRTRGSPGPT